MIDKVILFNGDDPEHFPRTFAKVATTHDITTQNIATKSCVISVGFGEDTPMIIHDNEPINTKNTAFVVKRTNGDTYRTYLISRLLESKVPLYVDEANTLSDKSADKITMTALLPLVGIGIPSSFITTPESYRLNQRYILDRIVFPVVVKKTGSKGKNVWKVSNQKELEERLLQDDEMTLIQEYVPNDHDLRVFVLDGEVFAAIKRSSADGFYNNVSQGGSAEKAELTAEERDICVRAAAAAKLRLAGVDLVRTPAEPLIFEVNKAPQLDIFSQAAGFDIEKFYSERVVKELIRSSK